jgi:hypothetical protein
MLKLITALPPDAFAAMIAPRSVQEVGVHGVPVSSVDVTVKTIAARAGSTNTIAVSSGKTTIAVAQRASLAVTTLRNAVRLVDSGPSPRSVALS